MSVQTKESRKHIYDFLEAKGIDLTPIRGSLRKLLMEYGRREAGDYQQEAQILRDRTRRHRAIIRSFTKSTLNILRDLKDAAQGEDESYFRAIDDMERRIKDQAYESEN